MYKNRVIYGLLNTSWVLINMAPRTRTREGKKDEGDRWEME